jgi:hypothetical protein
MESTLVYVVDHQTQYCWTCVQSLAQAAERSDQAGLSEYCSPR